MAKREAAPQHQIAVPPAAEPVDLADREPRVRVAIDATLQIEGLLSALIDQAEILLDNADTLREHAVVIALVSRAHALNDVITEALCEDRASVDRLRRIVDVKYAIGSDVLPRELSDLTGPSATTTQ